MFLKRPSSDNHMKISEPPTSQYVRLSPYQIQQNILKTIQDIRGGWFCSTETRALWYTITKPL